MKKRNRKKRHAGRGRGIRRFPYRETVFSLRRTLALAAMIAVSACATTNVAPEGGASLRSPRMEELFLWLGTVDHDAASLLAPKSFEKTSSHLHEAIALADSGDVPAADRAAAAGLESAKQIETTLAMSRKIFREVLDMRHRAIEAGARHLFPARFEGADQSLRDRAAALERGDPKVVQGQYASISELYASLEQDALKADRVSIAKGAIEWAEKNGADEYAPSSMTRARRELARLSAETPTNTEAEKEIAARTEEAVWWARRADEITRLAKRFENARELISPEQGEVLRKGENVILRLHGFDFSPGESDVEARNFGLLNDVIAAIEQFPDPTVKVIGHTDSLGDDEMNAELSIQRAKAVAAFLHETGGIPLARIESEGRGEAEPVATNDTGEGRAKNRRIEVIILNEANVPYTLSRP